MFICLLIAPTVLFMLLKGREHKIIINSRCNSPHRNGTFDGTASIKAATKEERNPTTEATATTNAAEEDANKGKDIDFVFSMTPITSLVLMMSPLSCPTAINEILKLTSSASSLIAFLWSSISSRVLVDAEPSCAAR